jgi:hypothetical protein
LLPFAAWAVRRNRPAWLVGSVFVSLVIVYLAYWIGSWLFGPRYYYEGLFSLTLFSAAGMAWLAGWPLQPEEQLKPPLQEPQVGMASAVLRPGQRKSLLLHKLRPLRKLRPLLVTLVVGVLVGINLLLYTPIRLGAMYGLYGIERQDQAAFQTPEAQALAPAIIIVHIDKWMDYGALLDLQDPYLSSPYIFAWSKLADPVELAAAYPERAIYHYYPDTPYVFYTAPRP